MDSLFDKRKILTTTYTLGLANVNVRNKNYVAAEKWTIIVGNDLAK